jgi:hypothetical protein
MAAVGDRVQVASKRVGQAPRDGVVTGVSGGLLRVTWSGGEESTITPSMGSLMVVGKVRARAKKGGSTAKAASKKAVKKAAKAPAKKATVKKTTVQKAARASSKKTAKGSAKAQRPRAAKSSSSKGSGKASKRRK